MQSFAHIFFKTYVFLSKNIGFVTELSDNSTKRFDISSKNEINIYPGFGVKSLIRLFKTFGLQILNLAISNCLTGLFSDSNFLFLD